MDDPPGYFTSLLENNILDELLDGVDGDYDDEIGSDELPSDEEPTTDEESSDEENQSRAHKHLVGEMETGEFLNNSMSFTADSSWTESYTVTKTSYENQFAKNGPINANGEWKGLMFTNKRALKRALEEWHVIHFVEMKVKKSDKNRYTCICVDSSCRWRLHAYKPTRATYFLVSQYNGPHNCVIPVGHRMHRNCTSRLICEKILPSMEASLSMSLKEIRRKIKDDLKTDISYQLAWKTSNPGTIWTMSPPWSRSHLQKFQRVFWAFGPSIEGWKNCRPVISVDGTHLYGKYEGHALIATSIDANGGLYPIAFATCEKENGDNWEWFLRSIKEFVTRDRKLCIISDRFSGNKEVVRRVFSPEDGHAHRWCLRHIKANLKKVGFTDKVLLDKFYAIGCANEVVDFNRLKKELKVECEDAWCWVENQIELDREYWALAFDGGRRFSVMTTNWSESFNSVIRSTRTLPITAFVAATFYRVDQAFVKRNEEARKITTQLCPKVLGKMRPRQLVARGYQVSKFGPCNFEVNTGNANYAVTINGRLSKCVCQAFQLLGLPCSHMLACCSDQWQDTDFHTLCDEWYFTETYRNTYATMFNPVPDKRCWPRQEQKVIPPALRKKRGRPKSTRIHTLDGC